MRITISESIQLPQGNVEVEIALEHNDGPVDPQQLLREVGRVLAGGPAPVQLHEATAHKEEDGNATARLVGQEWKPPKDLHGKQVKTIHRMVQSVEELTRRGQPAVPQDVSDHSGLSLPTVYNALRDDSPAVRYVRELFLVGQAGRTRVLDLTAQGRRVASLIRAGRVKV